MPGKRAETRLFWSVELSLSVQWTRYTIECIRLLEEVMREVMQASVTLPLSGTVPCWDFTNWVTYICMYICIYVRTYICNYHLMYLTQ